MEHVLVEKLKKELIRRNYSPKTVSAYIYCVNKFLTDTGVNPYHVSVQLFNDYIRKKSWTSISKQNIFINALKNFFIISVGIKKFTTDKIVRPKNNKTLPEVLDAEFIRQKLNAIVNIKHKAILTLTFSVGLRVSEIINLKISDIDSARMMIRIEQSKGKKDRFVPLSENTLNILRHYYTQYRPNVYLFNGQNSDQYSIKSCQNIFKQLISDKYSIHALRHSCFTTLLECGTDISVIQKIAGHSKIETTQIYTKVSNRILSRVALPA